MSSSARHCIGGYCGDADENDANDDTSVMNMCQIAVQVKILGTSLRKSINNIYLLCTGQPPGVIIIAASCRWVHTVRPQCRCYTNASTLLSLVSCEKDD